MPKLTDVYIHPQAIAESNNIGKGTRIWAFAHILRGAVVGRNCNIGDHCYIEGKVKIGNEVVIKNGVSLWEGVTIENHVFVGPNVTFTNDSLPRAKVYRNKYDNTLIKEGASIGANATLISPIIIGCYALVGGGAVVTHDVPDFGLVYGNPARLSAFVCRCAKSLPIGLKQDGKVTCSCGLSYKKQGLMLRKVPLNRKNN
jgi:UDP-2-acetamido-3-amino-2,3-dideoxy-glucuronate N-acetyltransferase